MTHRKKNRGHLNVHFYSKPRKVIAMRYFSPIIVNFSVPSACALCHVTKRVNFVVKGNDAKNPLAQTSLRWLNTVFVRACY